MAIDLKDLVCVVTGAGNRAAVDAVASGDCCQRLLRRRVSDQAYCFGNLSNSLRASFVASALGIRDDRLSFAEHVRLPSGNYSDWLAALIIYDCLDFTGGVWLLRHDGLDRYAV